ncbi:MFS transporter [Pseudovibrio sp. Tun.PSC04-5.I4]|uniref:MFS transporter n=1 Tax=Pseudovibrio sp. Tun.PSC04-5.I4 TaxID=1798213 RepID=UPI000882A494|nr:MFS transporter [Pseudovibrio sp. Tun.PSC04-5.I4]SDQ15591.1 Sugar phosphate permease [Pseudovibrio sp. Tun.PSC04-5.I4]
MHKDNLKRYFQFFLIVIAAGAIYPVIYLRTNYQETILEVFNLALPDLNNFYSVLGLAFVFGYIPSGLLSDKFSAKWLISISLIGTAICGFWFGTVPDQSQVRIIFLLWGFFAVFTFWSSHMKIVKMLARTSEEGRFFGILDGGRGVVEALMGTIGLAVFAAVLGSSELLVDKSSALVSVINLYSAIVLAAAVLIIIFVESEENLARHAEGSGDRSEAEKFQLRDVAKLLKNKNVFLMGSIIFMGYAVFWTVYYLGGFMQTNAGVDAVTVGIVMTVVLWMRPVGGFIGGYLADRIGRAKTICGAVLGSSTLLVIVAIMPLDSKPLLFVIIVALGAFLYAIRGTYWSLLGRCQIDAVMMGTAIGVISFMGYLPDIILPQLNSYLWNVFGATGGYNAYFIVSAGFGVLGGILALVHLKLNSEVEAEAELKPVLES